MRATRTVIVGLSAVLLVVAFAGVATFAGAQEEPDRPSTTSERARTDVGTAGDVRAGDAGSGVDTVPSVSQAKLAAGRKAFGKVAKVLKSPRCMNCHPDGDRPLQTDESRPHKMNVSRRSVEGGLECAACHRDRNSEAYGVEGGPPGAPHWQLPPAHTPMIFENRTVPELCEQLKDPEKNGGKDLDALLHHVAEDPLVLWGWNPGGDRTKPPLSHDAFVEAFTTWVESGGACPD